MELRQTKTPVHQAISSVNPNFVWNQYATRLWINMEVVKVSKLYNAVSVNILRRDGSIEGVLPLLLGGSPFCIRGDEGVQRGPRCKLTYREPQEHHLEGRHVRKP